MKPLTLIGIAALVLASVWITSASAILPEPTVDTSLYIDTTPNSLPADQDTVEPAQEPSSESGPAVVWQNQVVTEWVQQRVCDGRSCRIVNVPRQVVRRVAIAAAKPFRTARVLYKDGITRTLELLRPVGAVATCTRSITQAVAGEQWVGTDEQIYVRQDDGTWRPKRDDARIPEQATLSPPAVTTMTPLVTQRVSYTPVMTTPYRARMPVFSRRCGPVRRLLGWCR